MHAPKWTPTLLLAWLALAVLNGCNLPSAQATPAPTASPSPHVVNLVVEQSATGVYAVVQGSLGDECTTLSPKVSFAGDTFTLDLNPQHHGNCPPALVAFQERLLLPTMGLPPGTYRVRVGDLEQIFFLSVPNGATASPVPGEGSTPPPQGTPGTVTPAAAAKGRITGIIWHDLCASGVEGQPAPPTPPSGCVGDAATGYHADGTRQAEEPGIAGVKVTLAQGPCPGTPLSDTTTDDQGAFTFEDLSPGTYCVAVNTQDPVNAAILLPGEWTSPQDGSGQQTVTVEANATVQADFGWDYQFLPQPEACEDRAEFVDETIPDGTEVQPKTAFTKTWTLRNTGTCTWTTEYRAVRIGGEAMDAPDSVPLPHPVQPGDEGVISVDFTAPEAPGTYRSEWQLQNAQGQRFGLGAQGKGKFWVEIQVPAQEAQLNLGAPTVSDPLNSAARWYLLDEADARFEMSDGYLVMHGLNPGMLDWWGLSSYPALSDAFIEATFVVGPICQGRDRYGLIVRAPNTSQGIILEFACNGDYRIYRWDGSNYTALKPWTRGTGILTGPNQTNRMGVWLKGATIKLYANRILLAEVSDSTYTSGLFGLVVGSAHTPDFTVSVDKVEYWTLP